jgi:hypothetical protein
MAAEELAASLSGIVHEETQVHDRGVDLTLAEVYEVDFPGRVDFGGDELVDADCSPHERVWRDEDDDYQWWHLQGGQYLIEHNESLEDGREVRLQTRDAVLSRGAFHPTLAVDRLGRVPLSVAAGGIRLKENARVSTLLPTGSG